MALPTGVEPVAFPLGGGRSTNPLSIFTTTYQFVCLFLTTVSFLSVNSNKQENVLPPCYIYYIESK